LGTLVALMLGETASLGLGQAPLAAKGVAMREFVIERTNEMKREWWTGSDWSEDEHEARWYPTEPDAPQETQDENARAVFHEAGTIAD
jgi:hypothetical protein